MRKIDMQNWSRREHFKLYQGFAHPHFGISANMDITAFYQLVKQRATSFTVATVYLISRAANAIPEFRYRIRGEEVVEHEVAHPSFTILVDEDIFSFCSVDYVEDFPTFEKIAAEGIQRVKEQLLLEDEPGRDDYLFMTAMPWVSFTSLRHPMPTHPGDCIPRFAWGKFFWEGDRLKMPLSVDGHHGVIDGVHVGRFYAALEGYLREPEAVLG